MSRSRQKPVLLKCPVAMCQQKYAESSIVERHLLQDHHVTKELLQAMMRLVKPVGRSPPCAQPSPGLNLDDEDSMAEISRFESQVSQMAREATEERILPYEMDHESTSIQSDEPAKLMCHTCSEAFPDVDSLYQHQIDEGHLKVKKIREDLQCWVIGCDKRRYRTLKDLQMHYKITHKGSIVIRPAEIRVYKCEFCRFAFLHNVKLNLHSQQHSIESARKCIIKGCNEEKESIVEVIEHMKSVHVGQQMSLQHLTKHAGIIKAKLRIELPPKAPYIPGITPEQASAGASSTASPV